MKAILFDLDGTLADTLPLYVRSYRLALEEQGIKFTDKEIVDACFAKTEEVICVNLGIEDKTLQFQKTYLDAVKSHFTHGKLFPGVLDVLNLAKEKGIKLAIISFAYNWYVDGMLHGLGIAEYFEVVIGHEDVNQPKPDPEAVYLVCEKLKIEPKDSLVVGDSKSDVVMGNSAGTKTALFHPSGHGLFYELDALKTSNPSMVISSFEELKVTTGWVG